MFLLCFVSHVIRYIPHFVVWINPNVPNCEFVLVHHNKPVDTEPGCQENATLHQNSELNKWRVPLGLCICTLIFMLSWKLIIIMVLFHIRQWCVRMKIDVQQKSLILNGSRYNIVKTVTRYAMVNKWRLSHKGQQYQGHICCYIIM